jgi:microcystin-dependent protein
MAPGQGPGLSLRDLGEQTGVETVSLIESEIPAHTHVLSGTTDTATSNDPSNAYLARPLGRGSNLYSPVTAGAVPMQPTSVAGSSQPHNNMQPYLTLSFCIALQGIFPPRS